MLFATQSKHEIFTQELNQTLVALDKDAVADKMYKLFEAGPRGGSIIYAITVVTTDMQSRLLKLYEEQAGHTYLKDTISLAATTPYGSDGTNHEFNVLGQLGGTRIDGAGNRSYYLAAGKSLKIATNVSPGVDKEIIVRVYGENY